MATAPLNYFRNVPANPSGAATGSGSGIQAGYGVTGSFVPKSSGNALITVTGTLANGTAGASANLVGITMGTGNAPSLGASVTGIVGLPIQVVTVTGSVGVPLPFTAQAIVNGLTPGVGYWIDVMLVANSAGTLTPNFITITALEL